MGLWALAKKEQADERAKAFGNVEQVSGAIGAVLSRADGRVDARAAGKAVFDPQYAVLRADVGLGVAAARVGGGFRIMIRVNLTQHTALPEQECIDIECNLAALLTFNEIPAETEIYRRASELVEIATMYNADEAMIGGPGYLLMYLDPLLRQREILPVYAFSRRESVEVEQDGRVIKRSVFKHLGFVRLGGTFFLWYDNTGHFDCASRHSTLDYAMQAAQSRWQTRQHISTDNQGKDIVWRNYVLG